MILSVAAVGTVASKSVPLLGGLAPRAYAGPSYNVTTFGAVGDGTTDNTAAFAAAIAAAQLSGGGTVSVPSGIYAFTKVMPRPGTSIALHGTAPVSIVGAGRDTTSLIEHVNGQGLLSVKLNGAQIEGLSLDTESHAGGVAVGVQADNTVLAHDNVFGGSTVFTLWYMGLPGASPYVPLYHVGNQVSDVAVRDNINNDGFSFSFQKNATISDVTHFGSRLALYVDSNVAVTNYNYTPNPACGSAENGFFITSPTEDVTIDHFVTSGAGGIIGNAHNDRSSSNIKIVDEQFLAPFGNHLEVRNVDGLTVDGASLQANTLLFNPPNLATGVLVENSNLSAVRFGGIPASSVDATFNNDVFPALTINAKAAPTFKEGNVVGPTNIAIAGGSWFNQAGLLYKGISPTFTIKGVAGIS